MRTKRHTATKRSRTKSSGWLAGIATLLVGAAIALPAADPVSAEPLEPVLLDETAADFRYSTWTLWDGRLMFQRATGELAVYDPTDGSIDTLVADAALSPAGRLPHVITTYTPTGNPLDRLVYYIDTAGNLGRADLFSGLSTDLGPLPPGAYVRDLQLLPDGYTVLLEATDGTTTYWYLFDVLGDSLPAPADSYVRMTSTANNEIRWGVTGYVRGGDAATEFWVIDRDGARPVAALPWITDYNYDYDGVRDILLATNEGGAGTIRYYLTSLDGGLPVQIHETTSTSGARTSFAQKVLVVGVDVVSFDGAFADWTLDEPALPLDATNARPSIQFDDGRIDVEWSWVRDGSWEDGPHWSYSFDGTDRVDVAPDDSSDPVPYDPNRIELFWGGVLQIVDGGGGSSSLLYTDPIDGSTSTLDTGTPLDNVSIPYGSARVEYTRDDSVFVSRELRSDASAEVTFPRGPGGDFSARGSYNGSGPVVIRQQCDAFDACSGSGLYVADIPSITIPRALQSLPPARLLDTRPAGRTIDSVSQQVGRVSAGSTTAFAVRDRGGVPDLAGTAMLNVTAINPGGRGFLTVFDCDLATRPNASNVNFEGGQTVANAVLAELSASGTVCVYSSVAAHIAVDVNGYAIRGTSVAALSPERFADTRPTGETFDAMQQGDGRLAAGDTYRVRVGNRGQVAGLPETYGKFAAAPGAVLLNVTAVNPGGKGFLTVFACDVLRPTASNLNFEPGRSVANAVVTTPDAAGDVCIYSSAPTDLIVDVNGQDDSQFNTQAITPARHYDSRLAGETFDSQQQGGGRLAAGTTAEIDLDRGLIESTAGTVIANVTAVNPSGKGFLTVFPCDVPRPTASNVNFEAGQNVPNTVLAKISAARTICVYASVETDLIVDATGYAYAPESEPPLIVHGF